MESKSISWQIEYKVVDTGRVQTMKISLQFNKEKNVAKWFKAYYSRKDGKENFEFINAKIIE
jgi:hypothetical protein